MSEKDQRTTKECNLQYVERQIEGIKSNRLVVPDPPFIQNPSYPSF